MKALVTALLLFLGVTTGFARAQSSSDAFSVSGTMRHTTLEGGCWYLEATNGKHYELVGEKDVIAPLHEEGLNVNLTVRRAKDRASICMVGEIVEVVDRIQQQELRHPVDLVIEPLLLNGTMHKSKGIWYVLTREHSRFEFKGLPPLKYRKIGARMNTTMRVLLDANSTKLKSQGLILGPAKPKPVIEK